MRGFFVNCKKSGNNLYYKKVIIEVEIRILAALNVPRSTYYRWASLQPIELSREGTIHYPPLVKKQSTDMATVKSKSC
jgi:hypothetical protein